MSKLEAISPIFKNAPFVFGMSSSNQYVPYLSVYLKSIIDNAKEKNYYDIVVFESDISDENKEKLKSLATSKNISIRFYNLQKTFDTKLHIAASYFAPQCYYRLACGEVFRKYKRALFTDIDLVCIQDLFQIFNVDIGDAPIAACEEVLWAEENRKEKVYGDWSVSEYLKKLGSPSIYYNTGLILINPEKFNQIAPFSLLLEESKKERFICQEQDVLNKVFKDKFFTLSLKYNFEIINTIFNGKNKTFQDYSEKIDSAVMYHFLAAKKVWFYPRLPKGYVWWSYARKTPFYDKIFADLIERQKPLAFKEEMKLKIKYNRYRFLSLVSFGKRKMRYHEKANFIEEEFFPKKKFEIREMENVCDFLEPAFSENKVAIAMSCSNEYVPYLSVCLESIKISSSSHKTYDIVVFERSITQDNKKKLLAQIQGLGNFSLRFVNPTSLLKEYNLTYPPNYALECFFRLTSPLILKNYSKIIFTDVDLVLQADISVLANEDLQGYPFGACKDLMWGAFLNCKERDWAQYAQEILHLKEPFRYYNTGVLLLDVKTFNEKEYSKKILEFVSKNNFRILEQDGLNSFFQTGIKYLDTAWNVPTSGGIYKHLVSLMPSEFFEQYLKDKSNPFIIHFAGESKPWFSPKDDMADLWWNYAKKTPFYEDLMLSLQEHQRDLSGGEKVVFYFKYRLYKILSMLTSSEKKSIYKKKAQEYKRKLKIKKK